MRIRQQININNTFHVLNFNAYLEHGDKILHSNNVNELNKIKKLLESDSAKGYTFVLGEDTSVKMIKDSLARGAYVKYLVDTYVPITIIFEIGNNRNFEVLYKYHDEFSKKQIDNMNTVRQVMRVCIYFKFNYPETSINKFLFSMNDTRFLAERVYIDFTNTSLNKYQLEYYYQDDLKSEYKIEVFSKIHEILARWHIQVHLGSNSLLAQSKLQQKAFVYNERGAHYGIKANQITK